MSDTLQAAYEVRDGTYDYETGAGLRKWATDHGIDIHATYRIEIHLLDCLFARVFQYDRTENSRAYCPIDHDHLDLDQECEIALRKPFDLPISSLPIYPDTTGETETR